jgi:putative ABC transport system substrate-binding protein
VQRRIAQINGVDPALKRCLERGVEDMSDHPMVFLRNVHGILEQSLALIWRTECWKAEANKPYIPSEWVSIWRRNGERNFEEWLTRFPEGGQRLHLLDLMTGTQKTDRLARFVTKNNYVLANSVRGFRDLGVHPKATEIHRGLKESGYTEGKNVVIEYRWAENQYDRLPGMAADLVSRQVTVIFAGGSVRAAKAATATIPIVFTTGEDPVKAGLVASLNRPGGNITGITLFLVELGAKRLELLRDLAPKAELVGLLTNPRSPQGVGSNTEAEEQERDARAAASIMGRQLVVVHASSESEIDEAFSTVVQQRAGALMVASDIFLTTRKNQLIALASRHAIPTIYPWHDAASAGGLIGYVIDLTDSYRQAGSYVGRVLQGAKPGELPVLQPTKFLLTINLKTAKALGLTVPLIMQMTANEVIE